MTFKVSGPSAEHLRVGNPTVIRGVGVTHLRYRYARCSRTPFSHCAVH
jgi:hypothetical protein